MSDTEDRDLRAAEYVLGVLDAAEQAAIGREAERNPFLQQSIAAWERRLGPLARLAEPVPPPDDLWQRVQASIGAPAAAPSAPVRPVFPAERQAVRRWQAATAVSLALAACLAVVALLPLMGDRLRPGPAPAAPPAPLVASLGTYGAPATGFIATLDQRGLSVRPAAAPAAVPSGRDLELWSLAPGAAAPQPLGVLPAAGIRLGAVEARPAGTKILISLEPRGGSPTGAPTGPVLFAGTLTRAE